MLRFRRFNPTSGDDRKIVLQRESDNENMVSVWNGTWGSNLMNRSRILKYTGSVVFVLGLSVLMLWMGGRFVELQNISRDYFSQCRFAQIESMILAYHEHNGAFPPTKYQAKPDGPIHSWRVLLLPYVDMYTKELYLKYDFSEPWNSTKNLAITKAAEEYMGHFSLRAYPKTQFVSK